MRQRDRVISAPRLTVHPTDNPTARWLAAAETAHTDPSGQRIWQIYESMPFARLWYSARDAGERMRAAALSWLYTQQAQPGGPYPDPRDPNVAFSQRAILSTAARQTPVAVQQSARPSDLDSRLPSGPLNVTPQDLMRNASKIGQPQAWLVTYPSDAQTLPLIMLYLPAPDIPQDRINFELACMLGYVSKDAALLLDPYAPPGISVMPTSPSAVTLLHQFAIALLCLDPACPKHWHCHCNALRTRYNAAPASHAQSTDTLSLAELAHETERMRSDRQQK